ncbi:Uncharacterised protein [Metamycoplasma alkalescens]|uniref:Transposase n=1 Tax=Metamycoplasma alkalescens TaxID=45363 RepID=A0A3B0PIY7_9BACT|nr:Uncharacterised protein [Metamycoplasma alkalescens]
MIANKLAEIIKSIFKNKLRVKNAAKQVGRNKSIYRYFLIVLNKFFHQYQIILKFLFNP